MKFSSVAALSFSLAASLVSAFPITHDSVACRSGPDINSDVKKRYAENQNVNVTCQTTGSDVFGNNIWDKTSDGCYVSDFYVRTGSDGFVTDKCDGGGNDGGGGGDGKIPGPAKNDYPYSGKCGGVDKWNYYKCQCTSFVAWRINDRLGIDFTNRYKGAAWGNANTWDAAAKKTGVTINSKPVPGAIAQSNAGNYGHVAWVTAVSGDSVTVEEYNYARKEAYGTRTLPKSTFNYIHLKV